MHQITLEGSTYYIENEEHKRIDISELDVFNMLDKLFKDKDATHQEC